MLTAEYVVNNEYGICARPAAMLVEICMQGNSMVFVKKLGSNENYSCVEADGRSMISLMMLAATKGTRLQIDVDGEDEEEVMESIKQFFESVY